MCGVPRDKREPRDGECVNVIKFRGNAGPPPRFDRYTTLLLRGTSLCVYFNPITRNNKQRERERETILNVFFFLVGDNA